MDVNQHQRFLIPEKSFASMVKRDITRLAEGYQFSPTEVGKINIIISEMLSNLAKHSPTGGELLVKPVGTKYNNEAFEIICLDNGPGISDPIRMMEDGVSTSGTAGEGLGAIKRQSDVFDLYSHPSLGTVLLSRVNKGRKTVSAEAVSAKVEVGYVIVPKPTERICGDGFALVEQGPNMYLLALDGLGHGTHANEAAQQAATSFISHPNIDPANSLRDIHNQIKRTRGAVGLRADISIHTQRITYCGVGNIAGKMFSLDGSSINSPYKSIISYNGILGHNVPNTLNNQQLDWGRNKLLVLHSDGLKSRWDLAKYPNLQRHHPTTIASVIYKDNSRQTDDTLVVVCKAKV
ncbi:SpoIIE family protein phosphatase [Pontibacter silvestris]|uniref:SpoIIE family protein phosphatase n=1 Tax=Pontibacter silvestris TaxID=2305183 RepID=A0ABW4X002_9BACT|nr:SpoIIE family protein phosphatase [Pontibacter silvestris]MCC9137460.1 SpoIIE family protein phosphatase [Pontibacter silvestris]